MSPDITLDNGKIILGKYTFLKEVALSVKVFEVDTKQVENNFHAIIPDM